MSYIGCGDTELINLFSPQVYHLSIETHGRYFHYMVNNYMFKTTFNFNKPLIKNRVNEIIF